MKVVHCKKNLYDVYIGRPSKWGNLWSHKTGTLAQYKTNTREEAIQKYEDYLRNNEELLKDIMELDGKILGCWCSPKSCHGDVIIKIINEIKNKNK